MRTRIAAAALLGALLMTGCAGGSGDGKGGAAGTPSSARPAGPAPSPSDGGPTEKAPESKLKPATGSFSKKEKQYLVGKVPKGVDPAAILQAGQDACDRIGEVAKVDEKAARSAIRTGEIANAEDAIRTLCPTYKELL
ncbi:hypothetical protein G5C51_04845 [Streptomyces sp. A7024]|uniref:DUF732 domain-containing protein n=1 Tax=Streptomyces coryli TaxID=1128680 RepID=A0A6G4TTC6_9ACTN|nr:hypothetical protein [Streptomyces coryli]NGN63235.1 hypothetical protein [Streptomyces coryli]